MKSKNLCDVGQTGQNPYCKCGHLKDHHLRNVDGDLQCQKFVFDEKANKMLQCGCKI